MSLERDIKQWHGVFFLSFFSLDLNVVASELLQPCCSHGRMKDKVVLKVLRKAGNLGPC